MDVDADGYDFFDLHIHTHHSDGAMRPVDAFDIARGRNLGLAITDHNEIRGSIDLLGRAGPGSAVPGIELATSAGVDILAYFATGEELERFYQDNVEGHCGTDPSSFTDIPPIRLLHAVADYGGLAYLAHPFAYLWKNWRPVLADMDEGTRRRIHGIEGANGTMGKSRNLEAMSLAMHMNKPVIGGSDAHLRARIGDCVTLVPHGRPGASPFERLRSFPTHCADRRVVNHHQLLEPAMILSKHARYWPRIAWDKAKDFTLGRKKNPES